MKELDLDIKSMTMPQLKVVMEELGEKPFRAKQIYEWLHQKRVWDYEEMTNLSRGLREQLSVKYPLNPIEMVRVQTSKIDGTQKYLFRLRDGNVIESVLMKYKHGNSVCISSQVGCRMGCRFCASTLDGLTRNLQFLRMVSDDKGICISQRNITVSTCGLVPRIRQLAEEQLQITLALSLHAPNDEKRQELMPIARKYTMDEVLDACRYYFEKTGRRLTFEYSLVGGVNDFLEDAAQLSARLKGLN